MPLGALGKATLHSSQWEVSLRLSVQAKLSTEEKLKRLERAEYVQWWLTALGTYVTGTWVKPVKG